MFTRQLFVLKIVQKIVHIQCFWNLKVTSIRQQHKHPWSEQHVQQKPWHHTQHAVFTQVNMDAARQLVWIESEFVRSELTVLASAILVSSNIHIPSCHFTSTQVQNCISRMSAMSSEYNKLKFWSHHVSIDTIQHTGIPLVLSHVGVNLQSSRICVHGLKCVFGHSCLQCEPSQIISTDMTCHLFSYEPYKALSSVHKASSVSADLHLSFSLTFGHSSNDLIGCALGIIYIPITGLHGY